MHSNVPTLPERLKVKKLIDQLKSHKITPLDVPNKVCHSPCYCKSRARTRYIENREARI